METFSAILAICAGNSPVPGEFTAQRPVTRNFDVFFYLRPNKRLSKQWWGWWFETPSRPLWRHCNDLSNWKGKNQCRASHEAHPKVPRFITVDVIKFFVNGAEQSFREQNLSVFAFQLFLVLWANLFLYECKWKPLKVSYSHTATLHVYFCLHLSLSIKLTYCSLIQVNVGIRFVCGAVITLSLSRSLKTD